MRNNQPQTTGAETMDNANLADAFPCAYCKKLIWPSRGPNGEIYFACPDCTEEEKQADLPPQTGGDEAVADMIIIDGITLTHRLFYDSGYPTGGTTGHKDGEDYVIQRDMDSAGLPWALCLLHEGQVTAGEIVRHLTDVEVAEYQLLLEKGRGRGRQVDHESTADDATGEVEDGRMIGGGPADI